MTAASRLWYGSFMTAIEFREWPKITRLNRPMIVTEKIDGTNAAVIVSSEAVPYGYGDREVVYDGAGIIINLDSEVDGWRPVIVAAQSRKKIIAPGKQDNAGFAGWVREHAQELAEGLGEGYHYGEWWGKGIQRGYGLDEKRFSLFNVSRWTDDVRPACCHVVPTLLEWERFDTRRVNDCVLELLRGGSFAVDGYDRPEGVVAYHVPSGMSYKVLCENDEVPKGVVGA